jgi:hypothetical protein
LKLDRQILAVAGVSAALVSPAAAQAPKASPKPVTASTPAPVKASTPAPVKAPTPAPVKPPAAPSVPADPVQEAKLRARATEYWKLRMTMNLGGTLPYYESSFRSTLTPEKFAINFRRLNRFAPEFLGIDGVRFDSPTKATIKVKLRTQPSVLDGQELITSTDESWVLEGGQWYKVGESMLPNL